jgi:hypothetical protein
MGAYNRLTANRPEISAVNLQKKKLLGQTNTDWTITQCPPLTELIALNYYTTEGRKYFFHIFY